ncbi:oligosaccharide flippase family protein [Lutibacter sp. A80]|uniref:oligosaccharide flippase family protein n=1 Tax=Lutibacter sp. A80 TaxID=2918453 RepID=UPI001F0555F0|nr:oligosaccharide flippase family protein [Lutibacter sp. A80]UMB60792.1 oligosaccharide flippase family protein [Lutibacter sp. A80]
MSNSFKNIAKSTSLVGGVQIFRLFFGLIRNKIIALFFGATGMGVWGLYLSFTEMIQGASSLGLEKSSVKQIAENNLDTYKRNVTIQVVTYSLAIFSLICSIIVAFFASKFSKNLFGTTEYTNGILICCLVIFINALTNIYKSILNGLREIKRLALSQFYGILVGNILVFLLVPFFGVSEIPLFFLIIAISAFVPTFLHIKKLKLSAVKVTFKEAYNNLSSLMKIGLAFWISAMFMTFITYLTKSFLQEELSVSVVGIYQASWTISNMYIGIVLSSMGVDFFPKICNVIKNKEETNKMINEQIEFGLLVSFPFIIGILIFAPLLLTLLYSTEFTQGASIIRWQMLGVTLRLLGFPFGYALMAKGKAMQYTVAQFIFSGINYLFIIWLVLNIGFDGLGINYFAAYVIYVLLIGGFCYKELNFRFNSVLLKTIGVISFFLIITGILIHFFKDGLLFLLGVIIILSTSYYSYLELQKKMDVDIVKFFKDKLKI